MNTIMAIFIEIVKWVYDKRNILKWIYNRRDNVALTWFKLNLKVNKPALTHEEAKNLAYIILGGEILKAIPYLDFKNKHMKIAVLRKEREKPSSRVLLLEAFAKTYTRIWESEDFPIQSEEIFFDIHDVDKDGIYEPI